MRSRQFLDVDKLGVKVAPAQCAAQRTVVSKWQRSPDTSVRGSSLEPGPTLVDMVTTGFGPGGQ